MQWLEFVPDDSNGSCHRLLVEPASPFSQPSMIPRVVDAAKTQTVPQASSSGVDSSSQRSKTSDDAEARMANWTNGIIDRLSSRSLIFIDDADGSDEEESAQGIKFSMSTAVKAPSRHELIASGLQSKLSERRHEIAETQKDAQHPSDQQQSPFAPPRLTQKRRPSYEKISIRDVTPTDALMKMKPRIKLASPKKPARKVAREQAFDPFSSHGSANGEDPQYASLHGQIRIQANQSSLPSCLPPKSPNSRNRSQKSRKISIRRK